MRQFLESFVWAFLILFTIPSILIVASWSSLPGEPMFGIKLGLEKALAFVVAPSYSASTKLAFQYTERRFIDARILLSEKHSVTGLVYLTRQVEQTQKTIEKAPDPAARAEAAKTYIATLEEVSSLLEEQKNTILVQTSETPLPLPETPTPIPTPTATPTPTPTPAPVLPVQQILPTATPTQTPTTIPMPTATPTPTPQLAPVTDQVTPESTAAVVREITNTQESIKETIKELKKQSKQKEHDARDQRSRRK